MEQIFEVVGIWTGHVAHLREAGAVLTLCGLGTVGWFAKRYFFPSQISCDECRDKYVKDHKKNADRY